ncbi:MAG TPA: hypothetical protein VGS10_07105 [Terracidiphilus sp.]|nr:hypothetical protein [Terracidiphilus sp.]
MALILATLVAASFGYGQAPSPQFTQSTDSQFVGVWRGQLDGLPAVVLNLTDESGKLSGAALFYFHERKTVHDPYTSTPGLPEPLFKLSVSGQTLRFEISHKRAHPPGSLKDAPVQFRLTVTGPDRAELVREAGGKETASTPVAMVRGRY